MAQAGGRGNVWMAASIVFLIVAIAFAAAYFVSPRTVTETVTSPTTVTSVTTATSVVTQTATKTVTETVERTATVTQAATVTVTQTVTVPRVLSLAEIAEMIRKGEIDVGDKYGMKFGERFHNIHVKVLGLSCKACHQSPKYADDYLYIRKAVVEEEVKEGRMPGVVDRGTCMSCHRENSVARTFYMALYGSGEESGASG
ncbi:MAG: hypothetical protein ABWW70_00980 [Thermoproteota archaeon]